MLYCWCSLLIWNNTELLNFLFVGDSWFRLDVKGWSLRDCFRLLFRFFGCLAIGFSLWGTASFLLLFSNLLVAFFSKLDYFLFLCFCFAFKFFNVSFLVSCKLGKGRWSHIVLQVNAIFWIIRKISFLLQLVYSIEPIVSPAFANFKLRLILSHNFLWGPSMADHFNTVLVFTRLGRRHVWGTFEHFKEYRNVVSLGILTISVRINFETPCYSIGYQLGWVDRVFWMAELREMS